MKRLHSKPASVSEPDVAGETQATATAEKAEPLAVETTDSVENVALDLPATPPQDNDATTAPNTEPTLAPQSPVSRTPPSAKPPTAAPSVVGAGTKRKSTTVTTEHRYHTVSAGHTLGKIAKRYRLKVESLCDANGLERRASLKVGQKLVIPNGDDDPIITLGPEPSESRDRDEKAAPGSNDPNAMKELSVPGSGPVYYYEPSGHGRQAMRPIVVYLHGRGGDAEADCRKWSRIARRFGWLLCPSGPTPHNAGRTWNNNWVSGQHAVMGAVQALRNVYGRRVQLYGNTLVGFSEGAYVAMNVGVRQPRTFNRWLILGADVSYWGGAGLEALKDAKSKVRRVVLITGGRDQVVDDTRTVAGWLENEGVPLRIQTPGDLAHEVALDRKPEMYVSALHWLDNGGPTGKVIAQAKR